ncbi:hypothetical protein GGE07_001441 [Sinorhizobium terangae]|nr:hypothetical protein [Sinorhizobium terangae]
MLEFFAKLPSCIVAMEACASAHYWGREIGKLGHEVRLINPSYLKPFVKRQKNDAADAEAIAEAASRPTMRFVPIKSAEKKAGLLDDVQGSLPFGPTANANDQRVAGASDGIRLGRRARDAKRSPPAAIDRNASGPARDRQKPELRTFAAHRISHG